jgi:hypothetical protein
MNNMDRREWLSKLGQLALLELPQFTGRFAVLD